MEERVEDVADRIISESDIAKLIPCEEDHFVVLGEIRMTIIAALQEGFKNGFKEGMKLPSDPSKKPWPMGQGFMRD